MNRCGMRYISWIEAILFVALVAMSAAVVSISRKVTETIREKTKPEAAAFERRERVEEHDRTLARLHEEESRADAKLVDARVDLIRHEAEMSSGPGEPPQARAVTAAAKRTVDGIAAYVARVQSAVRKEGAEAAKHRYLAAQSFRQAKEAFDWNTRVIAAFGALAAVLVLFVLLWVIVSLPIIRSAFDIHRGVVFGGTAIAVLIGVLFEIGGQPAVVVASVLALFVAIIALARVAPSQARHR